MNALRVLAAALAVASAAPAWAAKKPLGSGERIDVARASVAELMRLPGIGRKKAEAIVALRGRSPFRRAEDLLSVKGVSARWLERQRAHVAVGAAPPSKPIASAKSAGGGPAR